MSETYLGVRGRVAVVTGGGRNIGRATALALAKAGAKLVIGDLVETNAKSVADEIIASGGEAIGLPRNRIRVHDFRGANALVSTTGYTGEVGYEIYVPPELAAAVWGALIDAGRPHGLAPVGLGARDTLRLEVGYALYGHELDDDTNGYEARVGWAVKLNKPGGFVGSDALKAAKAGPLRKKLAGLRMLDRGIAREGYAVLSGGQVVGKVTSGTHAPTRKEAVALAYLPPELTALGSRVEVDVRGQAKLAEVVPYPFVTTTLSA